MFFAFKVSHTPLLPEFAVPIKSWRSEPSEGAKHAYCNYNTKSNHGSSRRHNLKVTIKPSRISVWTKQKSISILITTLLLTELTF
jgi:hypothetical protein